MSTSAFGVVHKGLPRRLKPIAQVPDQRSASPSISHKRSNAVKRMFGAKTHDNKTPEMRYVSARVESNVSGRDARGMRKRKPGHPFGPQPWGPKWSKAEIKRWQDQHTQQARGNTVHRTTARKLLADMSKPGKFESKKANELRALRLKLIQAKADKKRLLGQ